MDLNVKGKIVKLSRREEQNIFTTSGKDVLRAKNVSRHGTEEGIQIARKDVRRCANSLVIKEMQLKLQRDAVR